jgi:hypothetical protein
VEFYSILELRIELLDLLSHSTAEQGNTVVCCSKNDKRNAYVEMQPAAEVPVKSSVGQARWTALASYVPSLLGL